MKKIIILLVEVIINTYLLMGIYSMRICNCAKDGVFENNVYENLGVSENYFWEYLNYFEDKRLPQYLLM